MTAREKPMTWVEWKVQHRWPRLTGIEWVLEWLVYWCRGLAIFEVLEFAGRASVLIAVILWFWEADNREKQSHYRAWELINSARGSTGDGGRRDALQDLNEDGVVLSAAPLAKAYLVGVHLPKAHLGGADLSGAHLGGANLSGAKLTWAHLGGAKLIMTDLGGANLGEANLGGANLGGANLENAKFCQTTMPDGTVNNRDCPPKPASPNPSETPPAPK